jgi:hypothetical protein
MRALLDSLINCSNIANMSVYDANEGSIPALRDSLLESALPDCREKCPVARAVAYETAVFIIREGAGLTVELVKPKFGEVISQCDGPEDTNVCGGDICKLAEGSKRTSKCKHDIHKAGGSILVAVKLSL